MKLKSKSKLIEEPVFKFSVLVLLCPREQISTKIKKHGIPDMEDFAESTAGNQGLTAFHSELRTAVVWVMAANAERLTAKETAALAHELMHVSFHYLDDIGMKLTEESEEAFTYLTEHLITEVLS